MNKASRLIKRYVALILVLLFSIESFAAVVGDNDGAAFITKAEFDSMKNDFQSQLDRYNSSIDNKIDGAIAAYLRGVSIASNREVEPLVDTYQEMMWQPNFKVFGCMRQFTDFDVYTDVIDEWFVPPADHRILTNQAIFFIWDWQSYEYAAAGLGLWGEAAVWHDGWETTHSTYAFPHLFAIKVLNAETAQTPTLDPTAPLTRFVETQPYIVSTFKDSNTTYDSMWRDANNSVPYAVTAVRELSRASDEAYAVEYDADLYGGSAPAVTWVGREKVKNINFAFTEGDPFTGDYTDYAHCPNRASLGKFASMVDDSTFTQDPWGISWVCLDASIKDKLQNAVAHLMFGNDNEAQVNVLQDNGNTFMKYHCYVPGTESASVPVKWTKAVVHNAFANSTNATNNYIDPGFTSQVGIAKLPIATVSEIQSPYFSYNNSSLKLGNGMPLILNADTRGYMQLSFDFDVKYLADDLQRDKNLWVDIKKSDFLSKKDDYVHGFKGMVNPDATDAHTMVLKRVSYESSDADAGHVVFTIPVEKNDSLWLRISPKDERGGYYAKMKNLKMLFVTQ